MNANQIRILMLVAVLVGIVIFGLFPTLGSTGPLPFAGGGLFVMLFAL